ncbi:hypothetical protein [Enterococcus sp. LJL90]
MKKYKVALLALLLVTFIGGSFPIDVSAKEGTVTIAGTLSPTETTETTSSSSISEEVPQISSTLYEISIDSPGNSDLPQLGEHPIIALLSLISGVFLLVIVLFLFKRKLRN